MPLVYVWLALFFSVFAVFDATLFCDDFNSSRFSCLNVVIILINFLEVCGTFPSLVYTVINRLLPNVVKWSHTILRQMLQNFKSVSDHFTTLRSKGLNWDTKSRLEIVKQLIPPSVGVITNMIGNVKCIFLFLKFLKNCVWSPCFLSDPQWFSLDISSKTTSE